MSCRFEMRSARILAVFPFLTGALSVVAHVELLALLVSLIVLLLVFLAIHLPLNSVPYSSRGTCFSRLNAVTLELCPFKNEIALDLPDEYLVST